MSAHRYKFLKIYSNGRMLKNILKKSPFTQLLISIKQVRRDKNLQCLGGSKSTLYFRIPWPPQLKDGWAMDSMEIIE